MIWNDSSKASISELEKLVAESEETIISTFCTWLTVRPKALNQTQIKLLHEETIGTISRKTPFV